LIVVRSGSRLKWSLAAFGSVDGRAMDDRANESAFVSALVTEHFVLQSAASTTVGEAAGRASLYVSALSSSLIAMGFVAQSPGVLEPFVAVVIPAVLVLGVFTVVRLVDTGVQNVTCLAHIARIRRYYRTLSPEAPSYFTVLGGAEEDEGGQALAALALRRSRLVGFFTTASMIAAINSIVAGVGVALAGARALGTAPAVVTVSLGLAVAVTGMTVFYLYQDHRYRVLDSFTQRKDSS
jgi:hypothetical protein